MGEGQAAPRREGTGSGRAKGGPNGEAAGTRAVVDSVVEITGVTVLIALCAFLSL